MPATFVLLLALLPLVSYAAVKIAGRLVARRKRRLAAWWPAFERDFWAYVEEGSRGRRIRSRHPRA